MKEIRFNGRVVKMYESLDETRIDRYMVYNRYAMLDADIGSSADAVLERISNLSHWIVNEEKELALKELGNMHQAIQFVLEGKSQKLNAFASLIHSIDGKERKDLSESGIQETVMMLVKRKTRMRMVVEALSSIKKNFESELELLFPKISYDVREISWHEYLKRKTTIILDAINKGIPYDMIRGEVEKIDAALLEIFKPRSYSGAGGAEVGFIKRFEETCIILSQYVSTDPREMSVITFYQALETIQGQLKAKNKKRK